MGSSDSVSLRLRFAHIRKFKHVLTCAAILVDGRLTRGRLRACTVVVLRTWESRYHAKKKLCAKEENSELYKLQSI